MFLLPFIRDPEKRVFKATDQSYAPEWSQYSLIDEKCKQESRRFVPKLVSDKITHYRKHFPFLFEDIGNDTIKLNLINLGDCGEVLQGIIRHISSARKNTDNVPRFEVNIYLSDETNNKFHLLENQKKLREYIKANVRDIDDENDLVSVVSKSIVFYFRSFANALEYAHIAFYEMPTADVDGRSSMEEITTGVSLGGITSGVPSVLNAGWYKTCFGTKHMLGTPLTELAKAYNSLYLVAYSGSSYDPKTCMSTEVSNNQESTLGKIYLSSNWVVFIEPKVDLSFFQRTEAQQNDLMIIHYSDQYTSASGYDDITVTQKSEQYQKIIHDHLAEKNVNASPAEINHIIRLFNAVNGSWLLRLISTQKVQGALDSNFSREKMSILSAIKLCMAYYAHPDIIWIPVSLEEMLRVSGGAGLSQNEGLLSAKNLGFERGPACDDILLVGVGINKKPLSIYLHPVEVKIGNNPSAVINKAREQVLATYNGLWEALWPNNNRDSLEHKLTRNFFMQMLLVSCEKLKLYEIYPEINWEYLLNTHRQAMLNEEYIFSRDMDQYIKKGTVISFKTDASLETYQLFDDVVELEFPEIMGSEYMIKSTSWIEAHLRQEKKELPPRLYNLLSVLQTTASDNHNIETTNNVTHSQDGQITETEQHEELNNNLTNDGHAEEEAPLSTKNEAPTQAEYFGMSIVFGIDLASGKAVEWNPNNTNQVFHTNTGIIGTMGTGKTQFTKSMIAQLVHQQDKNVDGKPLGILIFDYKGDYNESKLDFVESTHAQVLKPYHLPFNPLTITRSNVFKPLLPIHTANAFKDTLSKVYQLGPKQQNALFTCILEAYKVNGIVPANPQTWGNDAPTFNMVYDIYMANEDIKKNDSLAAVMDKLYQFQIFEGSPSQTKSLFDLLNGVVVIDLSGYDADIQSLIVAITLDLFYSQMQAAGSSKIDGQYRQLTKLILVDEADNFMSEGFPALKRILKEGREFGVGTILSTQFLKHFGSGDDDYSKYILTWVVHNVSDLRTSDVEFVFKTEARGPETQMLYNRIKQLQKHHSIVKIGTHPLSYIEDLPFWKLAQWEFESTSMSALKIAEQSEGFSTSQSTTDQGNG